MNNNGEILADLLEDYKECFLFLHNTKTRNVAEIILREGFIFENQLAHSTDLLNPPGVVEVTYFLLQRKEYGPFTVVMAVNRGTLGELISAAEKKGKTLEEMISETNPYFGDNEELVYRLPNQYILGYFDNTTSRFNKNPGWKPEYLNPDKIPHKHQ
jgi:hypothetical protein